MENIDNTIENTIVAFHTGRGGRFNNPGHVTFQGVHNIGYFTDSLFINHTNEIEVYKSLGDRENLVAKFEKCRDNDDFSFFIKKGFDLGEKEYFESNQHAVGLTEKDVESGVGTIDSDGQYDTTSSKYLKDCSESDFQLILDYTGYIDGNVINYAKEALGIEDNE